jgi:hypothetical protein
MKTKDKIKKILLNLVDELEYLSKEQEKIVREIYEKHTKAEISTRTYDDLTDKEWHYSIVEMLTEISDIEELFDGNEIAFAFYNQNLDAFDSLLKYASDVYELYDDLEIEYLDKLQEKKLFDIKVAKEKDTINVKEFELLYGYSKESQKGYRGRIKNPLPYIQKSHGSMILYKKIDVEEWLKNNY